MLSPSAVPGRGMCRRTHQVLLRTNHSMDELRDSWPRDLHVRLLQQHRTEDMQVKNRFPLPMKKILRQYSMTRNGSWAGASRGAAQLFSCLAYDHRLRKMRNHGKQKESLCYHGASLSSSSHSLQASSVSAALLEQRQAWHRCSSRFSSSSSSSRCFWGAVLHAFSH